MNIYNLKYIETPRLLIRPVKDGDEIELNAAINRSLPSLQQWMPWAKDPSLESTNTFVKNSVAGWQSQNAIEFPMVVIHKETSHIIAATGFNDRSIPVNHTFEIGYWIDSSYQGQGFVTEYVNALTRYALGALGAQRVQIDTHVDNQKSMAVAKRCGFTKEFVMKNERLDCETGLPADSVLYACCDTGDLPSLKVSWDHHKNKGHAQSITSGHKASKSPVKLKSLNTTRLKLLPPSNGDTDEVLNALKASVNELSPWFPWATQKNLTINEVARNISEDRIAANDIREHKDLFYFVWDKDQNSFLGEVWLEILDWSVMSACIGYWFDSRHTGKGYAREAVGKLVEYAFHELNAKRIAIDISVRNEKSLKLPKHLNFSSEGIMRNYYPNFVTNEITDAARFVITDIKQLNNSHRGGDL